MGEEINRSPLFWQSREVVVDTLLAELSLAMTFCAIAKRHDGDERADLLLRARRVKGRVEEFCTRQKISDPRIAERMHQLKAELESAD